ncbi:protein of unknown function DUF362 [Desulfatibacillum aliphaticivorans]|uniref:DUF362 domain-containing protein n=1 Tax=Desulfatibacillum aliphaticivorans TaxID=218208 RepID=B8F9T2_DESAL|nr:DUF362 domain-containing protein [Desulfatibacillum aliphaticivorans]ACL03028.1 protein of unknown function DUF362 [Desulfatibacillum aliphaticivorans]
MLRSEDMETKEQVPNRDDLPAWIEDRAILPEPETIVGYIRTLGLETRFGSAISIIIKPNFAGGSALSTESHAVTNPEMILRVINGIRLINQKANIFIAESDSAGKGYAFLKFENMGISAWNLHRVNLLDLSRDRLERAVLDKPLYFKDDTDPLWLSETYLKADLLVSMANLKTHAVTAYTGACKNLFGVLPREDKYVYHPDVHKVIYDLVRCRKPDLSIVDGYRGMEENGPISGRPVNLGVRIWSGDAVTADLVSCKIIDMDYKKVNYLALLNKDKPLQLNADSITRNPIKHRTKLMVFFNYWGLKVQRAGYNLYMYGHRIHSVSSWLWFVLMTIRPVLLKFFNLQTLKTWKRKYLDD